MRNIILTIVILDTTSLYQIMKVPSLIRHFVEHKSLNHNIDFIDYLAMHYGGKDIDDDDDEKDMQLPFKKVENTHANFLFISGTESFSFVRYDQLTIRSKYGPDKPQLDYSTTLGSLFRPPRA
ncbi:hypothetical protein IEE83_03225 [Dyadobacter sp. UP-52]|uniref:Uncharacterized protein n=1 Tax=Dyadobacter subterraneus TaxID=2773304 RepID=A0ABR9W618_9BACT|nr:hypothetical protein [Dyadobacter subterraneus]